MRTRTATGAELLEAAFSLYLAEDAVTDPMLDW